MPDEKELFQTTGKPWAELALQGELDAVLTGTGNHRRNLFLHHVQLFAAERASRLLGRRGRVVDFGCGTGRFVRFFAKHGHSLLGTEITNEMLEQTKRFGLPEGSELILTNGIAIPVPDATVDLIWVCGVLRYSLNVPNPVYDQIAREMFRVLKPGGRVVNFEMYVDQPPSDFTKDFEAAGFDTAEQKLIHRHSGRFERFTQLHVPIWLIPSCATILAWYRYHFDSVDASTNGLRDYLFVWRKR